MVGPDFLHLEGIVLLHRPLLIDVQAVDVLLRDCQRASQQPWSAAPIVSGQTRAGASSAILNPANTAEQIGTAAWQAALPVFELTTEHATLEEAFMQLTDDSVDFRSHDGAEAVAAR